MKDDVNELVRQALEQLPEGVVIADAHDHVVASNARARQFSGRDSVSEAAFPLFFSQASSELVEQGLAALHSGVFHEFSTLEGDPLTGHIYEHHCVSIVDQQGLYEGTVATSRDVTGSTMQQTGQPCDQGSCLQERFLDGMITLVNALEARDQYTCGHSTRVASIAGIVARSVLDSPADIAEIELAARLHDIGKVAVPDRVLDKPAGLTADETALMDTHPLVGASILQPIEPLHHVATIIRAHHEQWNGHGYPDGLQGEQIPVGSRILALADTFDAMTSRRPYRGPVSVEMTCCEIEEHLGTQFDPSIGRAFVDMARSGHFIMTREGEPQ